jgi:hypothetical protein
MKFNITPRLTESVFTKLGKLSKEDLDLVSPKSQVEFCAGFIDSLYKEAKLTPDLAIGVIELFCDAGQKSLVENFVLSKEAAEDQMSSIKSSLGSAKERLFSGVRDFFSPIYEPKMRSSMNDVANEKINSLLGGAKQYGEKTWEYLKSPEFIDGVAPMLVGGLIGGLAPKAFGGGAISSGVGAAGGALLGNYVSRNKGEILPEAKAWIDNLRKQTAETFKSAPIST